MLIDTHCHLDAREFADDRAAVVGAARAAGVSRIVIPAVAPGNWATVRDCCRRYPGCFAAYGIHPLYLDQASPDDLISLRHWLFDEMAGEFPPVAVGEIGLDFFVTGFDAARQEDYYVAQLRLARDLDLPVLLHVRRSVDQILKGLRRIGAKAGIAHAFNGSTQQADEFIRLGFKLGFGGSMTYPGSKSIRRLATTLPLEAIVLETDAPDISPVWRVGRRNSPEELAPIAEVLAELRSVSVQGIQEATTNNANSVLRGFC